MKSSWVILLSSARRGFAVGIRRSGATVLFALFLVSQNITFAADASTDPGRQSIGWVSKRGVAVCIDPGGYFVSNVERDRDRESITITVPVQSASRGLAVTSSGNGSLNIFRVEASDLFPLTVAASLPKLPVDVTVCGYNATPDGLVHAFSLKQAKVRQARTGRSSAPSTTPDAEVEGLNREEYPDGAALIDAQGQLVGLLLSGPARQVRLFTAAEASEQLHAVIADQRHQDASEAARAALGPDFSHPAPPIPIPAHLSSAQASLAAVFAGNVREGSTAVCIDPFGLYLTVLQSPLSNESLFLVRKDSAGRATRMPAKAVGNDNHTGLTAVLVDTSEPLTSAPLPQSPTPTGALYATKITCLSPDAYISVQNTIQFNALRGRLHWHWAGWQQQALFNREPFLAPAPAGALFDDAGAVVGMTRYAVPPNAEYVALVPSPSTTFLKPLVTFLTPTATASTLTSPRDFYFHLHGLKPQDDPAVHLSFGAFGTWRTYAAQRVSSGEFVVRAVALATAPASRVEYKVELLINNSVVDTRSGQVTIGGASAASVAADNVRDLGQNRSVVLPLPGLAQLPTVGGNGRYLIFKCNDGTGTIAVLDVPAASLRTLDVNSSPAALVCAAGAEKLLVLGPSPKEIRRFDLETLTLEATAVLPDEQGLPQRIVLGSGSRGPAVIGCQSGLLVIDLQSLRPLTGAIPSNIRSLQFLGASASGRVVTGWAGPAGVNLLRWNGATFSASVPATGLRPSEVFPDPDGDRIYTGTGPVVLSTQTTPRTGGRTEPWYPAADTSEFFLGVSVPSGSRSFSAVVYHAQTQRQILSVPLEELKTSSSPSYLNRSVWLFAACGKIVVLPPGEPKLILHPANISQEMASRQGMLCFRSIPPRVARAGQTLKYQVQALSAHDEQLKFTLEHGPHGIQLDSQGQLSWAIPPSAKGTAVEVVVSVKDSAGASGTHNFTVYVE